MSKLTARQQEVFELIQRAIERTGFPPTRAEIAAELGLAPPTPPRSIFGRWRVKG
jgi:repressor LexA